MSRVVMFVLNDVRTDARVLRESASLAAAGHVVTVIGRPTDTKARTGDRQERAGVEIVRAPLPSGWRAPWIFARYPWRFRHQAVGRVTGGLRRLPAGLGDVVSGVALGLAVVGWSIVRGPFVLAGRALGRRPPPGGGLIDWLVRWRFATLGWARSAARAAPEADVYHGHDLSGLPAALEASRRNGGRVIYDSHEIFLESGTNATRPRWARALFGRLERGWARRADALVTVNDALAAELGRRLDVRSTVVVHNCPPRWTPPAERPDHLRHAAGIPAEGRIALYHGGFSAHRGLEELAAAIGEPGMERVHAVYMGYGTLRPALEAMAADPRYGGRLHVVDPVPPEALVEWVASADVAVMALRRSTLNHYLSTPNKLFEALAAGVPVVASDFPELRRVLLDDPNGPLGELCDPTDPADVARAIRRILDRPPEAVADLRARCLRAAHERWNWETESAKLVALYAELTSSGSRRESRGDR